MRIFEITLDSNCFPIESPLPAIKKLLEYNRRGLIDLVRTESFDLELNQATGADTLRDQIKGVALDHGIGLIHTIKKTNKHFNLLGIGVKKNKSILNEISQVMRGNATSFTKHLPDVTHLDTHYINNRDFFITSDGRINKKCEKLKNFGIEIKTPDECLEYVDRYLLSQKVNPDFVTLTVGTIIVGTNIFSRSFSFGDFHVCCIDGLYLLDISLYDKDATPIAKITSDAAPSVINAEVELKGSFGRTPRIVVEKNSVFSSIISQSSRDQSNYIELRILESGALLVKGKIFDHKNKTELRAEKDCLEINSLD